MACAPFFPINARAPRTTPSRINGAPCAAPAGGFGWRVPDIIGNLRIDQAWGYAGISVALHDVSGAYWSTANNVNNGHPADKYGWAVGFGAQFNLVRRLPGSRRYDRLPGRPTPKAPPASSTNSAWWQLYKNSNQVGVAWAADAVFGGPTGNEIELTRAWSINAAYQHFWNRKWRTSWYGGYVVDRLQRHRYLAHLRPWHPCGGHPAVRPANECGSRRRRPPAVQLQPGPQLLPGRFAHAVEPGTAARYRSRHVYTKLNTAFKGPANLNANGSRPACINALPGNGGCSVDDQGVLSAMFRWQRNFYP